MNQEIKTISEKQVKAVYNIRHTKNEKVSPEEYVAICLMTSREAYYEIKEAKAKEDLKQVAEYQATLKGVKA